LAQAAQSCSIRGRMSINGSSCRVHCWKNSENTSPHQAQDLFLRLQ
jgi:hypothetical protein